MSSYSMFYLSAPPCVCTLPYPAPFHSAPQTNATMDLVLFEDAMKHIARIVRVVMNSGGHALLGEMYSCTALSIICTSAVSSSHRVRLQLV